MLLKLKNDGFSGLFAPTARHGSKSSTERTQLVPGKKISPHSMLQLETSAQAEFEICPHAVKQQEGVSAAQVVTAGEHGLPHIGKSQKKPGFRAKLLGCMAVSDLWLWVGGPGFGLSCSFAKHDAGSGCRDMIWAFEASHPAPF